MIDPPPKKIHPHNPLEQREYAIPLKCIKKDGKLRCYIENPEELGINPENIDEEPEDVASSITSANVYGTFEPVSKSKSKSNGSSIVSIAILISILSGFGFATAYYPLYILYDYSSDPTWQFDIKMLYAFLILLAITVGLTIITYYTFKQKNTDPKSLSHVSKNL